MTTYLKEFDKHSEYNSYINGQSAILPNVSYCHDNNEVHYNPVDFSKLFLRTTALEDGTITFNIWKSMGTDLIQSISYSTDDGETWTTTMNQNNKQNHLQITVNVEEGDRILWQGRANTMGYYDGEEYTDHVGSFFSSTARFNVDGNVMSLIYDEHFIGETTLEYEAEFSHLFSDYDNNLHCLVVNAKDLSLPATTLTAYCYSNIFAHCTSLISAPEFNATTMAERCYVLMFAYCTSLVVAPDLPATTMAERCYASMFLNCTSLVVAPDLPATTMATYCYANMFKGCTSLVNAPVLPALTLTSFCYSRMFEDCTSLNYVKAMFTTEPADAYSYKWLENVAANGTFVKNSIASWNVTGTNAIPSGWVVKTA